MAIRFTHSIRSLLLLCALALPSGAGAQVLGWNDISGPQGYSQLYELSDGTLYAIDENVLYRSFDGGASWENIPRPGGPILEFAARGSTTMLAVQRNAANFKQYFISWDRGTTWTRVATEGDPVHTNLMLAPDGTAFALYPAGSKMAVERLEAGVWQRVGVPSGVYSNPTNAPRQYTVSNLDESGAIYIGTTADGIHSSRDFGQTWTKTLSYFRVTALAFGPGGKAAIATLPNGRTAGGVFVSGDHGLTWSTTGLTDVTMLSLEFNASGDVLVLGSRSSGGATAVYRLDSGVAEWDSVDAFDFDYSTLHVSSSGKYIATSPGLGLLVSTDDGATWHSDGIRGRGIYSLSMAPDGSLLAGTLGTGLFRTTDSGARWARVTGENVPEIFYFISTEGERVYAGAGTGLFASDDNGLSWWSVTAGLNPPGAEFPVYAIVRAGSGALLIGTGAGIFRSDDGGATWVPSGLGSSTVRGIVRRGDGVLYAATATEGVFASSDDGNSWFSRGLVRPDIQTIGVNDAGALFVGVASGVFLSADDGASWTRKIFTYGHVHSLLFNGNFNIYAGSSYGLFVTSDGGQSWASAGLDALFVVALAYDQFHAITAAVYNGGVARSSEIITGISDAPGLPVSASLSQNYPNPFNPVTTIGYTVPLASDVTLRVYDLLGRVVGTLVDGHRSPGAYEAVWRADGHPSGVYFYSITIVPDGQGGATPSAGSLIGVRTMLLLR